jgi:hypothetical protein
MRFEYLRTGWKPRLFGKVAEISVRRERAT